MSTKGCILSFGATLAFLILHWRYLTNPEDPPTPEAVLAGHFVGLVVFLAEMLVLFLPTHVFAWWHQYDTMQRDRFFLRWIFGVCAVLLVAKGLAHDAWHYGFLRWSDVDYPALNTYVDCRFEKALHDCCPAGCNGSALAMDLNMTSNFLGYLGFELTNDSCHNMTHNWNWTSDCIEGARWKGSQIVVDLPHLLKVEL